MNLTPYIESASRALILGFIGTVSIFVVYGESIWKTTGFNLYMLVVSMLVNHWITKVFHNDKINR